MARLCWRNSRTSRSWVFGWSWLQKFACAGLLIAGCTSFAFATSPSQTLSQYVYDSWGLDKGFPNETITSIAQTNDGYLWIGTDKSLIRFDGLNFEKFPQASPALLPINAVQSLVSDDKGNLWILLPTTKLLRYHDGVFELVRGEAENGVTAIGSGTSRTILISSLAMGALSYDGTDFVGILSSDLWEKTVGSQLIGEGSRWSTPAWSTGLKPHRLEGSASGVISIGGAGDGGVWFGTEAGALFQLKEGRVSASGNIPGARISAILPVSDSEVWVGTSKGLWRWDGHELTHAGVPALVSGSEVLSVLRDGDGNVWVGTDRELVRIGSAAGDPGTVMSSGFGAVRALLEDREGNIWIGGARGLQRLSESLFVTYSIDGSNARSTGAVYVDSNERTWVAPIDGGLRWLKGEQQGAVAAAGIDRDVVYSIAGGEKDEVWLGRQRGGLTRLQDARGLFATKTYTQADGLAQDSVYAVYRSRDGTVWAGTLSGGVSALHEGHFTTYTTANGLASNTVSSIAEAEDGTMWIGTPNGLSALTKDGWRSYSIREGLSSPDVNCLLSDSSGVLWIGTAEGLAFFKAGRIRVPGKMLGLVHEPIFGIAEDQNGDLWIATASRVLQVRASKLLGDTLQDADVRVYGVSDGLLGKEGVKRFQSVVADEKGRVWFSTNRGVSVVNLPRALDSPPAVVHIVGVSADGNALDRGDPLLVPPGKARVAFRFVGLSLKNSERVRYRYRLDNFDQGWSEATANREATYGNLRPGSYRFHVTASNSDGIWNGQEAAIGFKVGPTLLQTWWFRMALVLCAGLVAAAIYQLRVNQLTGLLNLRFEERLAERTRIAQELHDTLLQGFQGLILHFQVASQTVLSDPAEAKETLDKALDRADQALLESRRAIQGIRSHSFSDGDLERTLGVLMHELASDPVLTKGHQPATAVIVEGQPRTVNPWTCEEISKIAQEALRNALQHGNAQRIESEIAFSKNYLRVRFRDDGIGIDKAVLAYGQAGHWGLTGMKERAKRLHGHLNIWSKPNAGTEVEVTIPAATAFEPRTSWFPFGRRSKRDRFDA
jgi:ligand-binding sensor domain-containing protein/signal transduction histidine kinase